MFFLGKWNLRCSLIELNNILIIITNQGKLGSFVIRMYRHMRNSKKIGGLFWGKADLKRKGEFGIWDYEVIWKNNWIGWKIKSLFFLIKWYSAMLLLKFFINVPKKHPKLINSNCPNFSPKQTYSLAINRFSKW